MVRAAASFNWGFLVIACIWAMVISALGGGCFLLLATIALDSGPLPRAFSLGLLLSISYLISAGLFWKFPWPALLVAWTDLALVLSGTIPWAHHSVHAFVVQFIFDIIFFFAANFGLVAFLQMKRKNLAERA